MNAWRSLLAWLAVLAADPVEIDSEPPRSYAAVSAAYATFQAETPAPPAPEPSPEECPCGGKCTNGRYQPDGAIWQKCRPKCPSCPKGG